MSNPQPLISRRGLLFLSVASAAFMGWAVYQGDYKIVFILVLFWLFLAGADVAPLLRAVRGTPEPATMPVDPPAASGPPVLDKETPP